MSDDYEQLGKDDGACRIMVHKIVRTFLKREEKNDRANVRKIGRLLNRLRELGPDAVNNTEQFRREGKFSSGLADGSSFAVFAVKAHQIRVYGGFRHWRGKQTFFCVDAVRKKKDKADMAKLNSAANALGVIHD